MTEFHNRDIENVQNPVLGAYLVWRLCLSYQIESEENSTIIHYCFLALPLCYDANMSEAIRRTKKGSGLGKAVERISHNKEHLVRLPTEIKAYRLATTEALAIGSQCGLLRMIYEEGRVRGIDAKTPRLPTRLSDLEKAADKLGTWFGRLDLSVVSNLLNVRL
jgi:hypothetical protein